MKENNKTYQRKTNNYFKSSNLLLIVVTFAICCLTISGCDNRTGQESRFDEAEKLALGWCVEAQMTLSNLNESSMSTDDINNIILDQPYELSSASTRINPESSKPLEIITSVTTLTDNERTPDTISKEVRCKMKSQGAIAAFLNETIPGNEGTCRELNEKALQWALDQLTDEERARYENEGKKLIFSDDTMAGSGLDWYGSCLEYNSTGNDYSISSPALLVPYEEDNPSMFGNHYCKLITPSMALYWVLHRAFYVDPINTGDEQSSLECTGCQFLDSPPVASCIFYFSTSEQYLCEDYTGSVWTVESATDTCSDRSDGVFSTSSCNNRTAETSILDDDGVHRGKCVINCGEEGEYVWNFYSDSSLGLNVVDFCGDWYPVGGG